MTPQLVPGSRHFYVHELSCKCGCGLLKFHFGFMPKLNFLRNVKYGLEMSPSSCCRCKQHNENEKGHYRSLHVADDPYWKIKGQDGCLAIDISTPDPYNRGKLFHDAWEEGWSIGEGNTFLHLDLRIMIGFPQRTFRYGG